MKPRIFAILALACPYFVCAQPAGQPDRCGADHIHQENMENPDYAAQYALKMEQVELWLKNNGPLAKADCDEILYLPVAVHFQEVGIDYACAIEMSLSQVETLNEDFGGTNGDIDKWLDNRAATWPGIFNKESCIQFCLATINHPAGSGIAEGEYAVTLNEYDADTDNVPEWSGYLNLFVRDLTGLLGYSPLGGNGNGDGVVCALTAFGSVSCGGNTLSGQYNLGRTATHEIGHYLSLSHPFDSGDCVTDGDGIDDTPFTNAATYGCYAEGEEIINCTEPILWPSYMDYCDDACLYMFSEDQVDQMEAYVNTSLTNLLNSASLKCQETACLDFRVQESKVDESCEGNDGRIQINASGGNEPYLYSIDNGLTTVENGGLFQNLKADKYFIYVTDASGCEYTDSIIVKRDELPLSLTATRNSFCGDNSGSLNVDVNYTGDFEFRLEGETGWQDTSFFGNLTRGVYIVQARNDANCLGNIEVEIGDDTDISMIVRTVKPINCPLFDNGLVDAILSGGEEPIIWRLNDGFPQDNGLFVNLSLGEYNLVVEDGRGCRDEFGFDIAISYSTVGEDCPCDVFIPNAITPDGDGLNDLLKVVPSCPINDFNLEIFDRWGQLVFSTGNPDTGWNGGSSDGYYVNPGVFFYRLTYRWGEERNESLEVQIETGNINVLR